MSKAPEWIYLDGDAEAGDGMFPRCFENPKYASEPQVEYVRVDLAEAAEQQGYASAMEDARKLHEARIEELEATGLANRVAIMRLEAKLAKAVEALEEAIYLLDPEEEDIAKETGIYRVVTTCKELKGEDQ